ncbi:MAG: vitamin K epoxide reductase family protein [Gemmatimonadaceae bacterium]|nr:vitamin K epoxide reductase family protein [Gemmatimonadaceae bacterium]
MKARMLIALLALIGVLVALYLTLYKMGVIGTLVCQVGSCERVNTSRWATFLGLPVAAWGLATYVLLLALALAGLQGIAPRRSAWGLVLLSGWSVLFSAWLTYLELFVIHAVCMWCVTSATLMLLIFISSVVVLREELRGA